mmetsp:Transcript_50193/g.167729  ORF Transcript_50193/g.167729 Transcript_50193/m.167729 type:complete len:517 (+) Transcript_50193:41-1591(+)
MREYSPPWMYGAAAAFPDPASEIPAGQWIADQRPAVIRLPLEELSLPLRPIGGPASMQQRPPYPAKPRVFSVFNPAITEAPRGLCPRCTYVVALRVDAMHQCNASSPLLRRNMPQSAPGAWFKGTALAVLDADRRLLGWTWLLPRPENQVSLAAMEGNGSRWFVPPGVSDGYLPPWVKPSYDTRLLNIDGRLFATTTCMACHFMVALVQVTATVTSDGGVVELRAWASKRWPSKDVWAQGRNQAIFAAPDSDSGSTTPTPSPPSPPPTAAVMVQPWLGLVASFGSPRFRERHLVSCYASQAQWWRGNTTVDAARLLQGAITRLGWRRAMRLQNAEECGPTPVGGRAMVTSVLDLPPVQRRSSAASAASPSAASSAAATRFGSLRLVANHTTAERQRGTFRAGRHRVSPTSNLILVHKRPQEWPAARRGGRRLHRAADDAPCDRAPPRDQQPRSRCSWASRGSGRRFSVKREWERRKETARPPSVQPRAVGSNGTAAAAAAAVAATRLARRTQVVLH